MATSDPEPLPWQTVNELFEEALRRAGEERGVFLAEACAGRPAVREAVERMLWADEAAGAFLEQPLAWRPSHLGSMAGLGEDELGDGDAGGDADGDDVVGRELGPYRIVERLATGGMGRVYRAERVDDAFERSVAIKMVRRRIVRADDLRRFRIEREVLARLDHPHVARLLDGGTTDDGRPFLVMELVDGLPIDRYCDERGLRTVARVELFQQVCAALEYAHQNLLIHRDVKPDNVLVTVDGTVKVLDFGIAKLLAPESLPFAAPVTRTGLRPMTPGYASPEQIRGQPATTRSEVFVLGALLYELLAGRSLFVADGALPHEVEAAICAVDGLPGGSARQTTSDGSRALRGDLGTIVGKALRADPAHRYGSVAQLSDDLTRWREHRPVTARPARLSYRLATFLRRNRALASLAAVALAGLVALGVALLAQTRTAIAERDRAERALAFVAGIFEGEDAGRQEDRPVDPRQSLDRSAERIERELAGHPDMQAVLFDAVGRMYSSLGWYDEARRRLEQSLAIRRRFGEDRAGLASALFHHARALDGLGDYERSRAGYDDCLAIRRDLFGPEHPDVVQALAARARADVALGRYGEAEPAIREALRLRRARLGEDHLDVAESLSSLGDVLFVTKKDTEGVVRAYGEALAIREAALGPDHLLVAASLQDVARGLFHAGRGQEALPVIQRAVDVQRALRDPDHPELARVLHAQGELARVVGSTALAEASLREAIDVARARLGSLHPETAHALASLGALLVQHDRLDEADDALEQARRAYEASYAEDHPAFAGLAFWRGDLLRRRGDLAGARRLLEQARRISERHTPEGSIVHATQAVGLGRLELDAGNLEAALTLFEDARAILQKRGRPEWFLGEIETEVGWCRARLGRVDEGREMLARGLERLESERPAGDPKIVRARGFLDQLETLTVDTAMERTP